MRCLGSLAERANQQLHAVGKVTVRGLLVNDVDSLTRHSLPGNEDEVSH